MKLQFFKNEAFEVEVKTSDGKSVFNAEAVAKSLGLTTKTMKNGIEYENVRWSRVNDFLPQMAEIKKGDFIPEAMVYKLAFKANNKTAEDFQDWLATDVLPSIRKHGMYATDELIANPDLLIAVATELKEERAEKEAAQLQLKEQEHQVVFAKSVEVSRNSVAVKVLATILKQNGVNIGQNRMFQWLRDNGYLSSRTGKSWNMPTQRSMDMGLFELKPNTYFHNDGVPETTYTPLVTGKGQVYFINKFKQEMILK